MSDDIIKGFRGEDKEAEGIVVGIFTRDEPHPPKASDTSADSPLKLDERTEHVTPNAPHDLKPFVKDSPTFTFKLRRVIYTDAELRQAVRDFATYLETTASPNGTAQREKLQSFATEFLSERTKP